MSAPDRLALLLAPAQTAVTGIDFVFVDPNQVDLFVFFHHVDPLAVVVPSLADLTKEQIRITPMSGEPPVEIVALELPWPTKDGRRVLHLTTKAPGGFSRHRLRIDDPQHRIDPYFNDVVFSFKANCPSELDCKTGPHECPPEANVDFPVDYRARDFWSFRSALFDFASERYPDWQDRLEADLGTMLLETMSALGDEFSYAQDRIAREAHLETATQRRSLRHLARLVDYQLAESCGAFAWLDMTATAAGPVAAGTVITDPQDQVRFEVGRGLADTLKVFNLAPVRNQFAAHLWDEDATCLEAGSTRLTIDGSHAAQFVADPAIDAHGKWVALTTHPTDPAVPERRLVVRVVEAVAGNDPLTLSPVTEIRWEVDQATPFEMDLETLVVRANLVPATAGKTFTQRFRIGPPASPADPNAGLPQAVERVGANGSLAYPDTLPREPAESQALQTATAVAQRSTLLLHSLPGSAATPLVWLPTSGQLVPEVRLEREGDTVWTWRDALIGEESAKPNDKVYTLEDGTWQRVVGFRRIGGEVVHTDYASSEGNTVRFGDGEFGLAPTAGSIFRVTYRLGGGHMSNVAADTLTRFEAGLPANVSSVTNPLAASGGSDAEDATSIRTNAPQAFRAVTYRAVRPEDYAEAAERLAWVQRAGASLRWTGSWLTVFVTPDPRNAFGVTRAQRASLEDQLDRFRQAGRETHALDPRYADVDLTIRVCVDASAYRGEVKERVLEALFGRSGVRPMTGFFAPDRFTFGSPLVRSVLAAAIQSVPGVRAVEDIRIRRRGWFAWRPFTESEYRPGDAELIRVTNSALLPERGAVRLVMEGGA